jgi:hypothetical protein
MQNIPRLRRKEISTIKPADLWTEEDDALFLKYCGNKRDKAYHTIARDSSCRPSEILGLRIKDLNFMLTVDKKQYAQITVNGKTGTRNIPLFSSIPCIKDWLSSGHPAAANPKSFLIPSMDAKHHNAYGNRMLSSSMNNIYRKYRTKFFPALLDSPLVDPEDKVKIKELLKKPFNPYIRRHSALTQKAQKLTSPVLRQHAGWTAGSKMETKYLHFLGAESNDAILSEIYGLETAATLKKKSLSDILKPKVCPNCNESNIPESKFCSKCKMVLTFDAYNETIEEQKSKDRRLEELEQNLKAQLQTQQRQQELLEALWLQQQQQQSQQQQPLPNKSEHSSPPNTHSSSSPPIVKVNKHVLYRRNEVGVPPTPWMQAFELSDPRKSADQNSKDFNDLLLTKEGCQQLPWQRLPGITKEQEDYWHNVLIEGIRREEQRKEQEQEHKEEEQE